MVLTLLRRGVWVYKIVVLDYSIHDIMHWSWYHADIMYSSLLHANMYIYIYTCVHVRIHTHTHTYCTYIPLIYSTTWDTAWNYTHFLTSHIVAYYIAIIDVRHCYAPYLMWYVFVQWNLWNFDRYCMLHSFVHGMFELSAHVAVVAWTYFIVS